LPVLEGFLVLVLVRGFAREPDPPGLRRGGFSQGFGVLGLEDAQGFLPRFRRFANSVRFALLELLLLLRHMRTFQEPLGELPPSALSYLELETPQLLSVVWLPGFGGFLWSSETELQLFRVVG